MKSQIVLMLHAHLPWAINHGQWPHGEDWLTEAICESYIPLLNSINKLIKEDISPNITIDFSPVLLEMLSHPNLSDIFLRYTDLKIREAIKDEQKFESEGNQHLVSLAKFWQKWYTAKRNDFVNRYNGDLIKAFRDLQNAGYLEIITCSASHGYIPLLADDRSVNLQIELACRNYQKHFHKSPKGMWLAECGYRPSYTWNTSIPVNPYDQPKHRAGTEEFLNRFGIEYFVVDQYLIDTANPLGWFYNGDKGYFVHKDYHAETNFQKSPLIPFHVSSTSDTSNGTAIGLARHYDLSMKVWSAKGGFPGHPDYLDFHKKTQSSLLRYWRVTDVDLDMAHKDYYRPDWVVDKLEQHASIFLKDLENKAMHFRNAAHRNATITLPFDMELFGHWWFEGNDFLEKLIRKASKSNIVEFSTASNTINHNYPSEVVRLDEGSWGVDSNHSVWMNDSNKWIWEKIYNAEKRLSDYYSSNDIKNISELQNRILKAALNQFLLLQASDWGFLIYHSSSKNYAEERFSNHFADFEKLMTILESTDQENIQEKDLFFIEQCEYRDSLFDEIRPDMWKYL